MAADVQLYDTAYRRFTLRSTPGQGGDLRRGHRPEQLADEGRVGLRARLARADPGAHVLDVACGSGGPDLHLARTRGARVAVDVNAHAIETANKAARRDGVASLARFVQADAGPSPVRGRVVRRRRVRRRDQPPARPARRAPRLAPRPQTRRQDDVHRPDRGDRPTPARRSRVAPRSGTSSSRSATRTSDSSRRRASISSAATTRPRTSFAWRHAGTRPALDCAPS